MRTIYVYRMYPVRSTEAKFDIPEGAVFLHTEAQRNAISLWFDVESEASVQPRSFKLCPTGGVLRKQDLYLGTVLNVQGLPDIVLHVFEGG